MYQSLFDIFKNENLTQPLLALKRIGKICLILAAIGIGIIQISGEQIGGSVYLDIATRFAGIGFLAGMVCFSVIALYSLSKTRAQQTTHSAIASGFKKMFLYIYLPAIIITIILVILFVLPRYQ